MSTAPESLPETSTDTVTIPRSLLQKMSEAAQAFEAFQDDLEDYLLAHDADFLARMRQAREHHRKGQTRSLDELKEDLCIE
jgi:acetoin utilization deacetylase AcuC-like enzyme